MKKRGYPKMINSYTRNITPVPDRLIECSLPVLSVILAETGGEPAEDGVNLTRIVQPAPAATLMPQVFVSAKSPLLLPVIRMLLRLSVVAPLLVTVTICVVLVVPTV